MPVNIRLLSMTKQENIFIILKSPIEEEILPDLENTILSYAKIRINDVELNKRKNGKYTLNSKEFGFIANVNIYYKDPTFNDETKLFSGQYSISFKPAIFKDKPKFKNPDVTNKLYRFIMRQYLF